MTNNKRIPILILIIFLAIDDNTGQHRTTQETRPPLLGSFDSSIVFFFSVVPLFIYLLLVFMYVF